jgi:choline kinase
LKALILAAGTATRLRPLTNNQPKCMLRVGEISIIERTIENILHYGIEEFYIVTGYLADKLKSFVSKKFPHANISYIHNPVYDSTNNIYSLWLAREKVENDDLLLLDSDIIFDRRIIKLLLNNANENCLALRSQGQIGAEEMKVTTDQYNRIREISKQIEAQSAAGESLGIEKFGRAFVGYLYRILDDLIENKKQVDKFYELAFQQTINDGHDLFACDIKNLKCIEIDTPDDMHAAQHLVKDLT